MAVKYKIGDVVNLKSGGPMMTVKEVKVDEENMGEIICVFFDRNETLQTVTFDPQLLEKVKLK